MKLARYLIVLVAVLMGGLMDRWQGVASMFLMALIAAIDGWVEVFANRHINVRLPTIFINHCDDMNSDRTEK